MFHNIYCLLENLDDKILEYINCIPTRDNWWKQYEKVYKEYHKFINTLIPLSYDAYFYQWSQNLENFRQHGKVIATLHTEQYGKLFLPF